MLTKTKTFNAHNINDGVNLISHLENVTDSATAKPVYIEQAESDPLDADTYTVDVQNKVLRITIKNRGNRYALIRQLKTWFKRGTTGDLVVTFTDENFDYMLPCKVVNLVQDKDFPLQWIAILQTGTTAWRGVTADVVGTWVVTGTSETLDVDVEGFDETYLSATLTPTGGPASGYLYQDLYQLPNTVGITHGLIAHRISVDTATLITDTKMQADCDDLRIINLRTGEELKRWIYNPNNADTGVWVNLDMKKGFALTLSTAIADTNARAYLQFSVNTNMKKYIGEMEKTGFVYHGTEWFYYTSTDAVNCRLILGQRGVFGTTKQTHAAADIFYYIQYPLLMKYGNSSVSAPSTNDANYDDTKPLIKLSSTNAQWIWDSTTKFYDPDHPNRTCGWQFNVKTNNKNTNGYWTEAFYVKQNAESGDPALGLKVASFQVGALWKPDTVVLTALFTRAAMIITASMTGDKYRSGTKWLTASLQRLTGTTFYTLWTELLPTLAAVWQAWTHNSVSVATGSTGLRLILNGAYSESIQAYAAFEALTCTADFNSSNVQTGAFLGETNAYPMELTMENTHADYPDAVTLDFVTLIDADFVIDAEAKSVTYDGSNVHSAMSLNDESRGPFIRLKGNETNTIQISGADLGTLSVVLSYYRRRL